MVHWTSIAALGHAWLWQALGSRLSLVCLGILLSATLVGLLLARALWRLGRGARPQRRLGWIVDNDGTATIEFALVMPILLFLVLILAQTTMLMGGNLFIHYAAFAAARTAIVQIPIRTFTAAGDVFEDYDQIVADGTSDKFSKIQLAAAIALVPCSGRLTSGIPGGDTFAAGLTTMYQAYGASSPPNWVNKLAGDQFRYAIAHTNVWVLSTTIDNTVTPPAMTFNLLSSLPAPYTFAPHEPVTVRVSHELNLGVPYVNVVFADGHHSFVTGQTTYYALVTAQTTLTNEGIMDWIFPVPPTIQRMN